MQLKLGLSFLIVALLVLGVNTAVTRFVIVEQDASRAGPGWCSPTCVACVTAWLWRGSSRARSASSSAPRPSSVRAT